MEHKLYVGNLSETVTDADLRSLFAQHGDVASAVIVTERGGGARKGFGFVQMRSADHAQAAITALNGTSHAGKDLKVSHARPKTSALVPSKVASEGRGVEVVKDSL